MNKRMNKFWDSFQTLHEKIPNTPPQLSVIIPFRDEGIAPWFLTRLDELCQSAPSSDQIEFIVVDSGSIPHARVTCREICERAGIRYVYHDSEGDTFSAGDARDYGAQHATGRALTFMDLDLRVADDFWPRLLSFMNAFGISEYKKRFFAIPVLYLTEHGTEEFLSEDKATRFQEFYLRWMNGDNQSVIQMAPCSSMGVIDRLHYLSIGGHNPAFRGHGFEDFELYHRLIEEEGRLPRPDSYLKETRSWDTATYNGFRSRLTLIGRPALLSNLFTVHLWHPHPKALSFYDSKKMKTVRKIWPDIFSDFESTGNHPQSLVTSERQQKKILVLGQKNTNITRCLRDAIPTLGVPIYMTEKELADRDGKIDHEGLSSFFKYHDIQTIVFNGPYGNATRLEIYKWVRSQGFPYLCFERGALPDSWFFDNNGFNADSTSYARSEWDFPLGKDKARKTASYINSVLKYEEALEKQGDRIGGKALAERLGTGGRKVLFIPLQRPSDTVTTYFAGAAKSCADFLARMDETAGLLKRMGWVVYCKKHPLEISSPQLSNIKYVPGDAHFIDLLEISNSVALINSGVGIYAMMMGKPCYIFGDAFYAFSDVNKTIHDISPQEICNTIMSGHNVDQQTVLRFLHYLTEKFYSFGTPRIVSGRESDGTLRTRTRSIDFYDLKIPGNNRVLYRKETWSELPKTAPLFERYKLDIVQKNISAKERQEVTAQAPSRTHDTSKKPRSNTAVPQLSKRDKRYAKFRKFRRDPQAFFLDSHNPVFRPLRHLFL